jgi:hypothetical protein
MVEKHVVSLMIISILLVHGAAIEELGNPHSIGAFQPTIVSFKLLVATRILQ